MTATEQTPRVRWPRFRRDVPESPAQRPWPPRAAVAWLALLGVTAVVIGGHDTVMDAEITVRLWGSLVFGAGGVLLAGAYGLHRDTEAGRALAMIAAFVGVVLGLLTFLPQVVNGQPNRWLGVWAGIMALSFGAAWIVRRATPETERSRGVWSQLPILKTAVSAGVFLSLGQFWYTSIYVPTTASASLTLETKLTPERQGKRVILHGTVTARNTSGTLVSVVGSAVVVSAAALNDEADAGELAFAERVTAVQKDRAGTASQAHWFASLGEPTVVARGRIMPEHTYLEPAETVTMPFITWVPAEKFDAATATVALVIARSRALEADDLAVETDASGNTTVITREIPETGWLRQITRESRYVHLGYDVGAEPLPMVVFSPDPSPPREEPGAFNERMWRFYGVNASMSSAVAPLER